MNGTFSRQYASDEVAQYRSTTGSSLWVAAGVIAGLGLLLALGLNGQSDQQASPLLAGVEVQPRSLGEVALIDHHGQPVDRDRFLGQWTLLFFGYSSCPDVCPATLLQLGLVKQAIAERAWQPMPQFFYVSVDPARDTIDQLRDYVTYFDPDFVAMTGREAGIADLERQLGAYHRFDPPGENGFYSVTHSAELFLIDPQGRLVGKFQPPMDPPRVARQLLAFSEPGNRAR